MGDLDEKTGLTALRAAGEATRLRILQLLAQGELTVKDLTHVLAQSQPRISRHLKLLYDAGLIERYREGSWVYFRLSEPRGAGQLARRILDCLDGSDPVFRRDRDQVAKLMEVRAQAAQDFFALHAADWDRLRSMHVDEAEVESAIRDVLGDREIEYLVDLGTGTGRILELLGDRYQRALGIDTNHAMLAYARAKLDRLQLRNAHVRQADLHNLPLDDGCADVVVMHQVLHFLTDPASAIAEARRLLSPGGRLLIVDFAPHELDELRDRFAHERLGFSDVQIRGWCAEAGLDVVRVCELAPDTSETDQGRPTENVGEEKLTVSVWLAQLPGALGARSSGQYSNELETIQ
jgi:ubiquinone/menaquinone biosynthesis C-methylase UbiE